MLWRRRRSPATLIGQYLKAAALRQPDAVTDPLHNRLQLTGWRDADSVAGAAFELAVRQAYGPGFKAVGVPDMVRGMRRFFASGGMDSIPQREAELLIRAALGEDVSVEDVPAEISLLIHCLIFLGLALDLGYSEADLDRVLVAAERIARERGFAPTLALT